MELWAEGKGKAYEIPQLFTHGVKDAMTAPEVIEALKKWAADTGKVDESSIKDDYRALCCL